MERECQCKIYSSHLEESKLYSGAIWSDHDQMLVAPNSVFQCGSSFAKFYSLTGQRKSEIKARLKYIGGCTRVQRQLQQDGEAFL